MTTKIISSIFDCNKDKGVLEICSRAPFCALATSHAAGSNTTVGVLARISGCVASRCAATAATEQRTLRGAWLVNRKQQFISSSSQQQDQQEAVMKKNDIPEIFGSMV
ncbi:MAG: hypothetical protein J6P87_08380, partial [Lachnospiraceae bacterium]|nr:hypothetical protein [Lachnospiraceae bacterium]